MHSNYDVGDSSKNESRTVSILEAWVRLLLLALFWWVLTKGDPASWIVGIATVLFATVVGVWLSAGASWRWRLSGFLRFVPFFAYCSLKGGIDVAGRAFDLRLPLEPALLDYRLRLAERAPRVFFADVVSGVFLVFIALAYRTPNAPPDPVPHAMVLTGVVVAFSATAVALSLVRRIHGEPGGANPSRNAKEKPR